MVQMAYSDYKQSANAFLARAPMMILQQAFGHLAGIRPKDYGTHVIEDHLKEDAAAVGKSLLAMFIHARATAPDREQRLGLSAAPAAEQLVYDTGVGAITSMMLPPTNVGAAIEQARIALRRDLASTANAGLVNETLARWKELFHDETLGAWKRFPISALLGDYWGGSHLPADVRGTTRKILRSATAAQASEATAFEAPKRGEMVSIGSFLDIKEVLQSWQDMLPQPTRAYRPVCAAPTSACADDAGSQSSGETCADAEEQMHDAREASAPNEQYAHMPDCHACTIQYTDRRGYLQPLGLEVPIGIDEFETARNMLKKMRIACDAQERAVALSEAAPRVVSVQCGIGFVAYTADEDTIPESVASKALHHHITNHVSSQFDHSLDALAHRDFAEADAITASILRARSMDARDLNRDFTNRAMAISIAAVASAAQGVEALNSETIEEAPTRRHALYLLSEAFDNICEVLEGEEGPWRWISATARDGAGATLRHNLTVIMQTILDIKRVATDYFLQHPLD